MEKTVEQFIEQLVIRARVLMIGGLAVIVHGLSRATKDADIWLEPLDTVEKWVDIVKSVLEIFQDLQTYDLKNQRVIQHEEIKKVVARDRVVRVIGLDRPLDIFRIPHNLQISDFDKIWKRAITDISPVRVPDEIDLLITKEETTREQDIADIAFLEMKVRKQLSKILKTCSYNEALTIFERYADHITCGAALQNLDLSVRELGLNLLKEWAEKGDPFAVEVLKENF